MAVSLSADALAGASAIGSGISGLLGIGANALSAYQQYQYQKDLMKYQAKINYNYGKKSAVNQYMWQRQGLENANFNPQLAWQGAEGVANTGWTSPQSAPSPDYNSGIRNALDYYNAYQSAQLMEKQGAQAISQSNLNIDLADKARTESALNNARTVSEMIEQEGKRIDNLIKNVDLDWKDKNYFINYMKTLSDINRNNTQNTVDMMNAETNRSSVQGQLKLINGQLDMLSKQGLLTDTQRKQIEASMKGLTFDQIKGMAKDIGTLIFSIYVLKQLPTRPNSIMTPKSLITNPKGIPTSVTNTFGGL